MIRAIFYSRDTTVRNVTDQSEYLNLMQDEKGVLWVDFVGENADTIEPVLTGLFKFHPLAVDDAIQENHVPKVDDWLNYLYIVLHALKVNNGNGIDTLEIDIFLGKNYMVTLHDNPIESVEKVLDLCTKDIRIPKRGVGYLLYSLTDDIVSRYMPVVDNLDDEIDCIEDRIIDNPKSGILGEVMDKKRMLLTLRRMITHLREVLNKLARDEYQPINIKDRVYFRDIYDHLVRLYDITDSLRDLISGALDTYLSVINNKMNDIMKTLTIITTMFMPITFLTGFFGMNFFQPIEDSLGPWTSLFAFIFFLALMVASPMYMVYIMKKRKWM